MSENDLLELKKDVKDIKNIVTELQIQHAVMETKQKMNSTIFGILGGLAVWMIKGFLGK